MKKKELLTEIEILKNKLKKDREAYRNQRLNDINDKLELVQKILSSLGHLDFTIEYTRHPFSDDLTTKEIIFNLKMIE